MTEVASGHACVVQCRHCTSCAQQLHDQGPDVMCFRTAVSALKVVHTRFSESLGHVENGMPELKH